MNHEYPSLTKIQEKRTKDNEESISCLCCLDPPKMLSHQCRNLQKCITFGGSSIHPISFLKSPSNTEKQHKNSRLPAFPDNVCNSRIHVLWYVKTAMLKSNCTNYLHGVHSSPWLLQSTELPQHDTKAIYITSVRHEIIVHISNHIKVGERTHY